MAAWQIEKSGDEFELASEAVSFRVEPEGGGTLFDLKWRGGVSSCAPQSVRSVLLTGSHYQRYALNQLLNGLRGAECDDLIVEEQDDWVQIIGVWRLHDLIGTHRLHVNATSGQIRITDRVEKSGPGDIRLQVLHQFSYGMDAGARGPQYAVTLPRGDRRETHWALAPLEDRIVDQDHHATRRSFLLSDPWLEIGVAGQAGVTRLTETGDLACAALSLNPRRRQFILDLYGQDFHISRGQPMERACHIDPPDGLTRDKVAPAPPAWEPERRRRIEEHAASVREAIEAVPASADGVTRLRREVAEWKLKEYDWYIHSSQYEQAEALLADADTALDAIARGRPAQLPRPGKLLYANDFKSFPHDWQVYGFASLRNDPENGLHLAPRVTVNMWTREEFEGPYLVEFDYRSTSNDTRGGTFLQLAGQCINPRDSFDFMASAMGNMPYYNFGISCYHLSFNRGDDSLTVCNFRKTGRDFYLLAQVPDPATEIDRWYRVSMVKNREQMLFYLDGRLMLEYLDRGHQGPVLDKGRIGIRNWGGQQSWIRDFRVSEIG